jgi:hypothetical protein
MEEPTSPHPTPSARCPNCAETHGAVDHCLLALLLATLEQRSRDAGRELTGADINTLFAAVDPDTLWERFGGPAVNYLEALLPEPIQTPNAARTATG